MLLSNVFMLNDSQPVNVTIKGERIAAIEKMTPGNDDCRVHFTDAVIFPGLINSHDHLDFNCFSPLGEKKYSNYTEWGKDIHQTYRENIQDVLKIPKSLRAAWGMYKNLLAGVTTVVNHGDILKIENPLINIYQNAQNLHSVRFQKRWKWKLNNPVFKNTLCVIHTGEGVDDQSANEIDELITHNFLRRKLVGVHGVAMNGKQAKKFSAVIWCPESNRILLDKQADIETLKANTRLVFGTDSTLTGTWDIWQHLRFARALQLVSDSELLDMITKTPARLWGLNSGELLPGKTADIVLAKRKNEFFALTPEDILMVMHKGRVRMFDSSLHSQLKDKYPAFKSVRLDDSTKFVEGDLPGLIRAIKSFNPDITFPVG